MGRQVLLLPGLMVIMACSQSLCASDSCREEASRLREQETLLKSQLQKQHVVLLRLQQLNQPGHVDRTKAEQKEGTQYADCAQVFSSGFKSNGIFRVTPRDIPSSPIRVYCDMSEGGGWTVIQRRTNGTERFNRSWSEYKDGFGDMGGEFGEFWLGNDNLHHVTSQGNYSLRINLEDFDGSQRYAEYTNFRVADEMNHYQLTFRAYVGTAGDALTGSQVLGDSEWATHQGAKFSTYDRDNDNYKGNCAQEDKGGWWFNKCHSAHLNGQYYPDGHYSAWTDDGIVWYPWRGWWYSLKSTIMKIRPTDFKMDPADDPNSI